MSETTPEYQRLLDGTHSIDTSGVWTVFADPALLSAKRLAEILADDTTCGTLTNFAPELVWQRRQLLRHAAALKFALNKATALTAQAEAQVAGLKVELGEQEVLKLILVKELKSIRNNGRYPLCVVCQNGPALCECNPGPPTKKGAPRR